MDFVWNLTGRCNLKCPGCWDPFKNEYGSAYDDLLGTLGEIDLSTCKVVTITGGEPLLHRDIFRLIKRIRAAGVPEVKICTNGTLLRRRSRDLVESGITEVHVSLDSIDEDAHASLDNADDFASSKVVIREIEGLRDQIIEAGARIKVVLVAVVDPRRLERFQRLLEFARHSGYQVSYQLLCPFDIWADEVVAERGSLGAFFRELEDVHDTYRDVLNFFNRLYLAAATRYALDRTHAPCGAGETFQVIDPGGARHACFRPGSDPINMGCFDERCLIWSRSSKRGERVLQLLKAGNKDDS
jgi:molybdenum cofactor biosynthesis enzyme MoaA